MTPAEDVLAWLEEFVLAYDLCPFAACPWRQGRVAAVDLVANDLDVLFKAALTQVQGFVDQEAGEVETVLLVLPRRLPDFEDFLDFVYALEAALADTGADALVQLAHFHPDYQFAETDYDDPGNRTNRSPYPVVQLLRVKSVARAVAAYPDVEGIPGRNVERMRGEFGRE